MEGKVCLMINALDVHADTLWVYLALHCEINFIRFSRQDETGLYEVFG